MLARLRRCATGVSLSGSGYSERAARDPSVAAERADIRAALGRPISKRVLWGLLLGSALVTVLEQHRLLRTLSTRYANADHALLWLAARDWSLLRVREPTFYGQPYGVTFEAIPTALLHAFGVPYNVALPTALVGMAICAWWLLAWAALRRGMKLAALLAVAAPVLVNFEHWVVVSVIGTGVGRLLAALCAARVLTGGTTRRQVALSVAIGGFAMVIDSASALLALPALIWASWAWLRTRRYWLPMLSGLCVPAAWMAFTTWFDRLHPDHDLHAAWSFVVALEPLRENWLDADQLFAVQALELYRHGMFVPAAVGCMLLCALGLRAWRAAAAVGCVLAQLLYLAALPKSLDHMESLWYPAARMTLTCPMALWFAFSVTLQAALEPARRSWQLCAREAAITNLVVGLLVLLIAGSASVLKFHWRARLQPIEATGLMQSSLELSVASDIMATCRAARLAADRAETNIVAFPNDGTATYACPALYPDLLTIYPEYERRYWVLDELASRTSERMILWGVNERACRRRRFRKELDACDPVSDDRALALVFKPQPALVVLHALGYAVRPFGPGCHPADLVGCSWWRQHFAR
jgi:hypothetical protein